jgi:hypothetical protein
MENKIVEMLFGSHLYGLDTPESDKDYKGIFMPSFRDIVLQRAPKSINHSTGNDKSKNTKEDIDREFYSLHYFVQMACEGQTIAMDMLHAPDHVILHSGNIWEDLVQKRHLFYSKNLKAFVGYCRRQASKYGIKGSRLAAARSVVEFLGSLDSYTKLRDVWSGLPQGEHIHFLDPNERDTSNRRIYQVVGKKFIEHARVEEVTVSLGKFLAAAGERAKQAERNEGVDWKAVSHAVRVATQMEDLLNKGTFSFPLHNTDFIKAVKAGKLDYLKEVAPVLEAQMDRVEELTKVSTLPEKVDRKFWDRWLYYNVVEYYQRG